MNILLIGSSIFIGSHLLNSLINNIRVEKILCTYLNNDLSKSKTKFLFQRSRV